MNTIFKRALAPALFASFAVAAIPAHAADSRDTVAATSDSADQALVEVCATSTKGKVPKAQVVKALHRMLHMGETPEAAKMGKQQRRDMQFQVFWKEVTRESLGG